MGRDIDLTDNGAVILREDVANGVAAITVDAPADLTGAAGSYAMELLDQLPAGEEFLKINAAGKWVTNAGGVSTLDAAYDSGGPGAGRVIISDSGAVEVRGAGGIHINTDGDGVPSLLAIQSDALFDAVILFIEDSDQKFEFGYDQSRGGLVIGLVDFTAPAFFMEDITADVGFNEVDPAARVHITDTAQTNLIVERLGNPICRIALRDSGTGGFGVVGIQSNNDDLELVAGSFVVMALDGGTGVVTVNQPQNQNSLVIMSTGVGAGTGVIVNHAGTADGILVQKTAVTGAGIRLLTSTVTGLVITQTVAGLAASLSNSSDNTVLVCQKTGLGSGNVCVFGNDGTGNLLFLNQDGNGVALRIDSEATSAPLIDLMAIDGNGRGDIAFGSDRSSTPSALFNGDVWYDGTLERLELRTTITGIFQGQTLASRYGANYGLRTVETIVAGVVTIGSGYVQVAAASGTADDLDTITSSPVARVGDTIVLTADIGDTITVTENGNVLLTGSTRVLGPAGTADTMHLIKRSDNPETWSEIGYANNS